MLAILTLKITHNLKTCFSNTLLIHIWWWRHCWAHRAFVVAINKIRCATWKLKKKKNVLKTVQIKRKRKKIATNLVTKEKKILKISRFNWLDFLTCLLTNGIVVLEIKKKIMANLKSHCLDLHKFIVLYLFVLSSHFAPTLSPPTCVDLPCILECRVCAGCNSGATIVSPQCRRG